MVNVNKLRAKIVENGTNVIGIASCIGINKSTMYRKIRGEQEFTVREVEAMIEALGISEPEEIIAIFFAPKVA